MGVVIGFHPRSIATISHPPLTFEGLSYKCGKGVLRVTQSNMAISFSLSEIAWLIFWCRTI